MNPFFAVQKQPEYLKGTETPTEIRELIREMAYHNPIVGRVLDMADTRKLDDEHMLLILAHSALTAYALLFGQHLDFVSKAPVPPIIVPSDQVKAKAEHTGQTWHWWNSTVTGTECGSPRLGLWITYDKKQVNCKQCLAAMRLKPTVMVIPTRDISTPEHQFSTSTSHGNPDPSLRHATATCSCGEEFTATGEGASRKVFEQWQAHAQTYVIPTKELS